MDRQKGTAIPEINIVGLYNSKQTIEWFPMLFAVFLLKKIKSGV